MAKSWIENVVSEYYRKLGFLVLENISYFQKAKGKKNPGWQEIDVVVVSENETKLLSCKRGMSPHEYEEVTDYFDMHVEYLKKSKFSWAINRPKVEKVLIIEYPRPEHTKLLVEKGIVIIKLSDLLYAYVRLLKDELNEERKEGLEPNFVTRTIKGLLFHGIIGLNERTNS